MKLSYHRWLPVTFSFITQILPTESACTTFNFLNQERRYVAAGLIPPYNMANTIDDHLRAQRDAKTLFVAKHDD